ncbi:hypothetical protein BayCH28_03655 [Mycolicibacterium sp. CH28]|uniref:hypothetical protein n=1 Tax=Mycolicibacterium sp. CH28 TaxID=2512237 RepID=UPI001080CF84|nr:hypothetical protein [Mycolicibacterium sp. CH28]TGD89707.1 hypothetical protein BayCH28_03655 [Mycolicibacterium sp. CH28]
MSRVAATAVHLTLWVLAGVLYVLFVLPRWWELMGETSHTLGTVLRIVAGVLFGLAALPVLATPLRTRSPELTPSPLAARLRVWSVILHVLAGALIVGTAVAEIWVSLDAGGPWLFGVYGAAAAVAILGLLAFSLAYTAEQPPKPPKAKKPKKLKKADEVPESEVSQPDEPAEPETAAADGESVEECEPEPEPEPEPKPDAEPAAGLRNKRPTGKTSHRLRRRNRGDVALDD